LSPSFIPSIFRHLSHFSLIRSCTFSLRLTNLRISASLFPPISRCSSLLHISATDCQVIATSSASLGSLIVNQQLTICCDRKFRLADSK
jgi:hypothetical protein